MKEVPQLSKYLQPPHQESLPRSLESFTYIRLTHMNESLNLDSQFGFSWGKIFSIPLFSSQNRKGNFKICLSQCRQRDRKPRPGNFGINMLHVMWSIKMYHSNELKNLFDLPPLMIVHHHQLSFKTKITICSRNLDLTCLPSVSSNEFNVSIALDSFSLPYLRGTVNVLNQLLICVTSIWYGRTVINSSNIVWILKYAWDYLIAGQPVNHF